MQTHHAIQNYNNGRIPVLDGLRFFAAFTVLAAHYSQWVVCDQGIQNSLTSALATLSGLGMPLFFVLSGFVIHYNYYRLSIEPGGLKNFIVARFTRLYPLYILIFLIEFIIAFHLKRGSCAGAGERWGMFLALPYYLTLTQDWIFGIIARNCLIYQYYMASSVAWSISLEVFFYLSYLLLTRWLLKQKNIAFQLLLMGIVQALLIIYLRFCDRFINVIEHVALVGFGQYATLQHGYQDSLLRWLNYFSPIANLPAFFFGTLAANIYLKVKCKPLHKFEEAWGLCLTYLSVIAVLGAHFLLYLGLAPTNGFFGRTASVLDAPLFAIMIFCLVRYNAAKFISHPLFVKLGEASYSIYLLHAFFGWYPKDLYFLHLNPWVLYIFAMICILIISRFSYVFFERPVQHWLRKKMIVKQAGQTFVA